MGAGHLGRSGFFALHDSKRRSFFLVHVLPFIFTTSLDLTGRQRFASARAFHPLHAFPSIFSFASHRSWVSFGHLLSILRRKTNPPLRRGLIICLDDDSLVCLAPSVRPRLTVLSYHIMLLRCSLPATLSAPLSCVLRALCKTPRTSLNRVFRCIPFRVASRVLLMIFTPGQTNLSMQACDPDRH